MNGKQNKKGNEIEGFNPKEMISNLTHCPGVYLMSNSKGEVIYVGKAKDLRRRVGSYFQGRAQDLSLIHISEPTRRYAMGYSGVGL